jgi:predicted secreted protein
MNSHQPPTPNSAAAPEPPPATYVSEAKRLANLANAQLSSGPTSIDGKAKSSLNAVKTGLTGRTVLLHTDDVAAYQQHVADYEKELRPAGQRECDLVQSIADSAWRLQRIPALEMAIYAQGRVQFANQFDDHEPALRPALIELHTALAYEKQLRNLQLQESRLHRRREKDLAELRQAQSDRRNRDTNNLETASRLLTQAKRTNKPCDPTDEAAFLSELKTKIGVGFEFSLSDIEAYNAGGSPVLEIAYTAFKRALASRNKELQPAISLGTAG